jgi:plastocyanin
MPINLKFGIPILLASIGLFALLFYGGAKLVKPQAAAPTPTAIPGTPTPTPEPGAPVTVNLVAKNILFNVRTITVPVDAEVTLILDNQDAGVPHNFALYTDSTTRTSLYVGPIFTGIETREDTFRGPATPGNYFFRCDVHPDTMTGTFVVQ